MKNLLILLMVLFSFAACSSDDPVIDDGGGNGNGNGSSNTGSIPYSELSGEWIFDKYYYTIEVDDAEVREEIKYSYENKEPMTYVKAGKMKFDESRKISGLKGMEGSIFINTTDLSDNYRGWADYFTKNDTIFFYQLSWKEKYSHLLKKGDRIIYNFNDNIYYQYKYPSAGVKKAIYYAEYVRKK